MSKLVVSLEELSKALAYFKEIEQADLANIDWQRNGVSVSVLVEQIEEWGFIGLSNRDFAREVLLGEPSRSVLLVLSKPGLTSES